MKFSNYINAIFQIGIFSKLASIIVSEISYLILRLRGICIGKAPRFYGFSRFVKASTATIVIGEHVSFRSTHTSNLIGINRPCIISALEKNASITIGDKCGFSGTVIGCFKSIKIGNNVRCGANTLITDGDWHQDDPRSSPPRPIVIEDNVWLGEGVKVLKGVVIGENTVVGVGSIVTKDLPANVIAAGNPCRVIKNLSL